MDGATCFGIHDDFLFWDKTVIFIFIVFYVLCFLFFLKSCQNCAAFCQKSICEVPVSGSNNFFTKRKFESDLLSTIIIQMTKTADPDER